MSFKKKILFFSPVHWENYPYRDQTLPEKLAENGYQCIFINPYRYKNWEESSRLKTYRKRKEYENIKIVNRSTSLTKSFKSFVLESRDNCKQMEEHKPDFIYSSDHLMTWNAVKYAYKKKIPFIFDVTDDWALADPSIAGSFLWKQLNRKNIIKYASAISCVSHKQYDFFKKKHPNVYLIPNAIEEEQIKKCQKFIPKEDKMEVNFIGSLRDWYDFDLLFSVFREIPSIQLHIYGDGPLLKKLKEKSKEISNIHIHGNIEHSNTFELLANSLFGIIPLKNNELNQSTLPIKLLDYWSANKAVISTPTSEIKKTAKEVVLYAETKKEWKKHILDLTKNKEKRTRIGEQSLAQLRSSHLYKKITQDFIRIFEELN